MDSPSAIFIIPISGCNSLGLARSFGRRNIKPYVFSCGGRYLDHRFSRFAKVVESPVIDVENTEFLDFVRSFARKLNLRPVLFPVNDISLLYITQFRDSFDEFCYLPFGDQEQILTLLDKAKFHAFIDKIEGIYQPKTTVVERLEDACVAAEIVGFPCILKPAFNFYFNRRFSKKCLHLESLEQLKSDWDSYQTERTNYLIQEIIPGSKICGWVGYYDSETRLLAHCCYEKIRQFPADFGVGTLFRVTENAELMRQGEGVLSQLGFHGIVDVEFKYDHRDSEWKIIEINPRTCMHNSLAAAAGVDIEFMAFSNILGLTEDNNGVAKNGVLWVETHKDFASFISGSNHLLKWLPSLQGDKVFAYFAKDDPFPFLVRMKDFFSTVIGSLARALSK